MKTKKVYTFKLTLRDFEPIIERYIEVDSRMKLSDFSYLVLVLFEMKASHLYKIIVPVGENLIKSMSQRPDSDIESFKKRKPDVANLIYNYELLSIIDDFPRMPNIITHDVSLGVLNEIVDEVDDKMSLWYDFGDDWFIDITLVGDKEIDWDIQLPILLGGKGYGIIEDCGGVYGLSSIVKSFKKKAGKDFEEYSSWLGFDTFNIHHFNKKEMMERLRVIPALYKKCYEEKAILSDEEIDYIERKL